MTMVYFGLLVIAVAIAFMVGRNRARALKAGGSPLHSLPSYHGAFLALCVGLPMVVAFIVWMPTARVVIDDRAIARLAGDVQPKDPLAREARLRDIDRIAQGGMTDEQLAAYPESVVQAGRSAASMRGWSFAGLLAVGLGLAALGFHFGLQRINPQFRARNVVERAVKGLLIACSFVAVMTTLGIVMSVLFETMRFFAKVPPGDFLFGLQWSPQTALRADQVGSSGAFGAVPLFAGTMLIMVIAMLVAGPVGLFAAIYMAEYATPRFRAWVKPMLEILAGIPTVVFGFFAALAVAPTLRSLGLAMGLNVASESALAAGLVMGVMIIPFVSSLSDDVINAVPQSLRDGSYAMGATRSETIKRVVLPAALPGIVSAFMLAISRAVGETMIVVMAAGLAANLTFNPLEAVTTVTVQIKTLLVGDQEFDSAKTLSAFALGFVLFFFTLILNVIALHIVKRYREQYD
ncbi:MAG: phosphate ABC transporter permease subunit PstC [Aestuariivirgaceae bacterium]